jgi:hypothetical protein
MPGPVLTIASNVQCAHLGKGTPAKPMPRVLINGAPVVTLATMYTIAACTFPVMTGGNSPPCTAVQLTTGLSARVFTADGPVLVATSQGQTVPNAAPVVIVPEHARVIAQ